MKGKICFHLQFNIGVAIVNELRKEFFDDKHWWIQGGRQGRAPPPPPGGPNSFIFMQFSAKIINKHTHFGSWRPPPGENPRSATDKIKNDLRYHQLKTISFQIMKYI